MELRKLFQPVPSLTAEEARAFILGHREGTYTLLDVRQPKEYEKAHLPGARLIPLPDLPAGLADLDPRKPTLVY